MNFKENMNISLESAVNKSTKSSKKKINIDAEYKKRSEEQESLNLVVVGHVDAGKSTMMGHLLVQLGEVNPRTITKFKKVLLEYYLLIV
jgi:GTPase